MVSCVQFQIPFVHCCYLESDFFFCIFTLYLILYYNYSLAPRFFWLGLLNFLHWPSCHLRTKSFISCFPISIPFIFSSFIIKLANTSSTKVGKRWQERAVWILDQMIRCSTITYRNYYSDPSGLWVCLLLGFSSIPSAFASVVLSPWP